MISAQKLLVARKLIDGIRQRGGMIYILEGGQCLRCSHCGQFIRPAKMGDPCPARRKP